MRCSGARCNPRCRKSSSLQPASPADLPRALDRARRNVLVAAKGHPRSTAKSATQHAMAHFISAIRPRPDRNLLKCAAIDPALVFQVQGNPRGLSIGAASISSYNEIGWADFGHRHGSECSNHVCRRSAPRSLPGKNTPKEPDSLIFPFSRSVPRSGRQRCQRRSLHEIRSRLASETILFRIRRLLPGANGTSGY